MIETKAMCGSQGTHPLVVNPTAVRLAWIRQDPVTRKNGSGVVQAYCLDPSCGNKWTGVVVGMSQIDKETRERILRGEYFRFPPRSVRNRHEWRRWRRRDHR